MINQTNLFSSNKNAFAPFQKNDAPNYAITKPFGPMNEKKEFKKFNRDREERRSKAIGISIASTAILLSAGVLAVIKGPAKLSKNINNWIKSLQEKTAATTQKSTFQSFYLGALHLIKPVLEKSKAIFNIMPLKDILVKKGAESVIGIKQASDYISNLFEKIAVRRLKKDYAHTSARFDDMTRVFKDANEHLLSSDSSRLVKIGDKELTVSEWINNIKEKTNKVNENYTTFFSGSIDERVKEMKGLFKDFSDRIWKATYNDLGKFFTSKNTYQTFISEEFAAKNKGIITHNANKKRMMITNDIIDRFKSSKTILSNIDMLIDSRDTKSCEILGQIKKALLEYKGLRNISDETQRTPVVNNLKKQLVELKERIISLQGADSNDAYKEGVARDLKSYIEQIENVIDGPQVDNKQEKVEDILNIYSKLFENDPERYSSVAKSAHTAVKSLNHSIEIETDKLYDKFRDINVGAPPTDALGVLLSVGAIGCGLKQTENKQERTSVALKYGIPTIGAILTALYCTIGLVSGGSAIVVGTLSGILMHKIGAFVDKKIISHNENSSKPANT